MQLTTEEQEADGARAGREIIAAAQGWVGWRMYSDQTPIEDAVNRLCAVTQLTLKAIEADRLPMDGAIYGIGHAIGSMLATQAPHAQQALMMALQGGLNRGNGEMRAMLKPKGRA